MTLSASVAPWPDHLRASPGETHLWYSRVEDTGPLLGRLLAVLNPAEREQATRFRLVRDRERFICARAVLRTILGSYLGVAPEAIEFDYGTHGKPVLKGRLGVSGIRFSLSHSLDLVLCGITVGRKIGVDVEWFRDVLDADQIVERLFSAQEAKVYRSLLPRLRQAAFFSAWTRKEAFLKAVGVGLNEPLDRVEVTLDPRQPAGILRVDGSSQKADPWSVHASHPVPGYIAAAVVEGSDCAFRLRKWRGESSP